MTQYNDYELLYLMNEFDEEAERIFFEKYTNLIKTRVNKFGIKSRYREDFVQEGLYMLVVAIRTYNEYSNKTFNKYFDLILQRKFIKLLEKDKYYIEEVELNCEDNAIKDPTSFSYEEIEETQYSEFEQKVMLLKKQNYKPREIAKILECDSKSVYNCLCRIKKKYNK